MTNTPAYSVTVVADSIEALHANLRDLLPAHGVLSPIDTMPFQELLLLVDRRCENEGYDMEVWKKGDRPEPDLPLAERKKAEAKAKLRGQLVDSLAEGTHAANVVKDEIEAEAETPPEPVKAKKAKATKGNGAKAGEDPQALKDRMILRLQELYTEGRKADVNKLLATYGNGVKTFSAIPADQFAAIAVAVEAL